MYELHLILVRMRLGDSDRALATAGLIGRPKAKALRRLAEAEGWLDAVDRTPVIRAMRYVGFPCIEGHPDAEPVSLRISGLCWPFRPRILWGFDDREPCEVDSRCNRSAKCSVSALHRQVT